MAAPQVPLAVARGKTLEAVFLYADDAPVFKPISAMPVKAPCTLTVVGHGVPDGWPVWIEDVKSPAELNIPRDEPVQVRALGADTLVLPALNATSLKAFSGVGTIGYWPPVDLTGYHVRAQVRTKVGGTLLFTWHSDPTENPDGLVTIEGGTITLHATADTTAALSWSKGVYDAELVAPDGTVVALVAPSAISVESEVTT